MLVIQVLLTEELAQTSSHLQQHPFRLPYYWAEGTGTSIWPQASLPSICVGVSRASETLWRWREKLQPSSRCDAHRGGDRAWKKCLKLFDPSISNDITMRLWSQCHPHSKEARHGGISALYSHTEQPPTCSCLVAGAAVPLEIPSVSWAASLSTYCACKRVARNATSSNSNPMWQDIHAETTSLTTKMH